MKTVTQYREDIASLMKKIGDIDAKCIAENRDPTEEETALKSEMMNKIDKTRIDVDALVRQEKIVAELSAPISAPETKPAPQNSKGSGIVVRDKDRFATLGEQLSAVINAGKPGGMVDPRLRNQGVIQNAATGLNETVPSEGGFLVQTDFSSELLEQVIATGLLAAKCKRIQISGNSNGIKLNGVDETSRASTTWGGIQVYMKNEAAAAIASKPTFREIELNLHKMIGVCYLTEELMADTVALAGWVTQGFVQAFGFKTDDLIVRGTGAGQPMGILNSGSLVSVAKETGQTKETILAENVIKMYSRMFAGSLTSAEWYINQNILPQLLTMSLAVGVGGVPVYLPPGNTLSNAPGGALLGRPVNPIEQASTLGTLGDIMFADLSNGYLLAEKGGIRQETSIHVQFLQDEEVLKFVVRLDGQTVRASALTPYKGGSTSTQSHVVALATRA